MNKIITKSYSLFAAQKLVKPSFMARSASFSLKEQVHFAKRLSFLMNAGVPLVEGLHILKDQIKGGSRGRMIEHVVKDVSSGQSLARSFSKFPRVFNEFTVSIIKVGESSGTLSTNLAYLADELKKKQILRRKVLGALVYPAVITCATFGITGFLMLYLFPKIMPVFASLHSELPLTTRIVMAISVYLQHEGLFVVLGGIIGVFLLMTAVKQSAWIHYWFDFALLRLPIMGKVMEYYNVANSTRTLGLLLRSGVRLSEALPIVAQTTKNLIYRREYLLLWKSVDRGERMSTQLLKRRSYFPELVVHMIAVGERSGSLSDTLVYLSELYEAEVDDFTKNISTLIEPALMVVMGIIVGFIAISIITPIYGITQSLHP
jgi:type IV pilus assembly protein PilC